MQRRLAWALFVVLFNPRVYNFELIKFLSLIISFLSPRTRLPTLDIGSLWTPGVTICRALVDYLLELHLHSHECSICFDDCKPSELSCQHHTCDVGLMTRHVLRCLGCRPYDRNVLRYLGCRPYDRHVLGLGWPISRSAKQNTSKCATTPREAAPFCAVCPTATRKSLSLRWD